MFNKPKYYKNESYIKKNSIHLAIIGNTFSPSTKLRERK